MDTPKKTSRPSKSSYKTNLLIVLFAVLGVFAVGVFSVTQGLRKDLYERVLQREASSMMPLVQYQVSQAFDFGDEISDTRSVLILALLEISNIEGILSVQLFDQSGESVFALPSENTVDEIFGDLLIAMNSFESKAVFVEDANEERRFSGLLTSKTGELVPVLEIYIPIALEGDYEISGVVRYVLDGSETFSVLQSIDADVRWQGFWTYLSGSILITIIVVVALNRLGRAYNSINTYACRLETANEELAAVARTAAIGSVATHLIHGLKNPLAGLQSYLEASEIEIDDEDHRDAKEAGKRMKALIDEVLEVIRSNASEDSYEIDLEDVRDILKKKHSPHAKEKSVLLAFELVGESLLNASVANIALLVCSNLIQNAIEATPANGSVVVELGANGESVDIRVRDSGVGFSKIARAQLFTPVQSSKPNGAGIGLAISSQMAKRIGANLELIRSSEKGSELRLVVPVTQEIPAKL
ncbi:HAMP domain-containing histidine kinase [Puniceicoccaceae bacterium K14]|nr:HAMP domain-containing histidine kinase [Puniceicoccaceae bacterium K14]